jgi:2'-5' RNA ligase
VGTACQRHFPPTFRWLVTGLLNQSQESSRLISRPVSQRENHLKAVIRSFIAIDLSMDVSRRVSELTLGLQAEMEDLPIRWVPSENIHLTLKFLGDVSVANVEHLTEILQSVAGTHHCFEISVGGIGVFPGFRKPRVIWLGVEAPSMLMNVQHSITHETERLGYQSEERDFSPHLTIGRVARGANYRELRSISKRLKSETVGFLGATRVEQLHLYKSDLLPSGAEYTKLFSARLMDEPRVS